MAVSASGYPESGLGSMEQVGPKAPLWLTGVGPSWNPETGLNGMGGYGGPIGTSAPMNVWGSDENNALNIANGWGL